MIFLICHDLGTAIYISCCIEFFGSAKCYKYSLGIKPIDFIFKVKHNAHCGRSFLTLSYQLQQLCTLIEETSSIVPHLISCQSSMLQLYFGLLFLIYPYHYG